MDSVPEHPGNLLLATLARSRNLPIPAAQIRSQFAAAIRGDQVVPNLFGLNFHIVYFAFAFSAFGLPVVPLATVVRTQQIATSIVFVVLCSHPRSSVDYGKPSRAS